MPEDLENNGSYRKYILDARYVFKPHTRNFHAWEVSCKLVTYAEGII
jgi:hypothetical protein